METLKPEAVASSLLGSGRRGATDLAALRGEIPQLVDELAAVQLRTRPEGWARLAPEAKESLVPDAVSRRSLDWALPQQVSAMRTGQQALLGGLGAHELAEAAARHFDFPGGVVNAATVLGMTLPTAWRLAKGAAANPNLLALPAIGGAAGLGTLPTAPRK